MSDYRHPTICHRDKVRRLTSCLGEFPLYLLEWVYGNLLDTSEEIFKGILGRYLGT
jgi:hypothetical protein